MNFYPYTNSEKIKFENGKGLLIFHCNDRVHNFTQASKVLDYVYIGLS